MALGQRSAALRRAREASLVGALVLAANHRLVGERQVDAPEQELEHRVRRAEVRGPRRGTPVGRLKPPAEGAGLERAEPRDVEDVERRQRVSLCIEALPQKAEREATSEMVVLFIFFLNFDFVAARCGFVSICLASQPNRANIGEGLFHNTHCSDVVILEIFCTDEGKKARYYHPDSQTEAAIFRSVQVLQQAVQRLCLCIEALPEKAEPLQQQNRISPQKCPREKKTS